MVTPNAAGTAATVTWAAPVSDGGSAVTGYTVSRTGAPDPRPRRRSRKTWTGLTPGATYLFSVAARERRSAPGVAGRPDVTMPGPTAPPHRPASPVSADAGRADRHVTWTAPAADGGSRSRVRR